MKPLLFAFQYFTNLPFPGATDWNESTAAASLTWLPLTGLVVGFFLAVLGSFFLNAGIPQYPLARIVPIMALELWIGGPFILRGFCSSCDGMLSRLGRIRSREIMKDSRLGGMGAIGLVFMLLAKASILAELSFRKEFLYVLLFYPCWSRWALSFAACNYPVAEEEGMAYFFKTGQKPAYSIFAGSFTLVVLILMPNVFYLAVLASFTALLFCCRQVQARLGGQTEDAYGLSSTVAELTFLLVSVFTTGLLSGIGG